MVTLSKIYTRTGDAGETRLSDNSVARKTDLRVEAYGHVDECNSVLGVAVALGSIPERILEMLALVRNELFDVGADLSTPLDPNPPWPPLRIEQPSIDRLEGFCDELQEDLPTLRSFILPGGTPAGAQLHVARTVARRAERAAWACYESFGTKEDGGINLLAITYLNRLSDLLFIMARATNGSEAEILWVPGTDREIPKKKRG
ncbi:cob(I)yrinic acid a,c-diamide adenosyltransferase [Tessaracoccus caeni]|uniref:cob(I)yrinic acid a,c-diamide adenosyltransferase n=1 Tax=Tessaracoccus caeni TaxID=3031239 RepID=UPI0023DA2F55|nr:cob(I)yrinic acid a,c-diamide adenosyltransferase [Tessaracoccus caeni]MDF1490112.1 cob(I)yrinic acid a,c-diamide adenosyltransferase [Tessaracoccus caeni]